MSDPLALMNEYFLHYLWRFQKFDLSNLKLYDGSSLTVFKPGHHNHDSGPDFEEAHIKIGNIEWAGQIEIHQKSSDWIKHKHHGNQAYNNVILHVVWEHDKEIVINRTPLPTLELNSRTDPGLLKKYRQYFDRDNTILCRSQLDSVSDLAFKFMLDRMLVERLEIKARTIIEKLNQLDGDWEAATYHTLASNFGFSTNKAQFIKLAEKLPYEVLRKNFQSLHATEALIFGQSGFLEEKGDSYQLSLREEFNFLNTKYRLKDPMKTFEWKFGRMRPVNFPTVRLAQFASFLHTHPSLFSKLIAIEGAKDFTSILSFQVSDYWQKHYDFGKKRSILSTSIGKTTVENILINSIAPLLAAYANYTDQQIFMDKAVALLESLPPESNRIINEWKSFMQPQNSFDSQALIQLLNEYCTKRKCLFCNVGISLLHS